MSEIINLPPPRGRAGSLFTALEKNDLATDLQDAMCRPTPSLESLAASIARAEAAVAGAMFPALVEELKKLLLPPTLAQIKREVALLWVCFQQQMRNDGDDLALNTDEAVADIAALEHLSVLTLLGGFRALRRTSIHRPVIAEMLRAIDNADGYVRRARMIVELPARLDKAKQQLAHLIERKRAELKRLEASYDYRLGEGKRVGRLPQQITELREALALAQQQIEHHE
jgi:hypothetical protein